MRWAANTSTGLVRKLNEDSAYAGRWLYAVADGLGGHVAGEVASATVVDSIRGCDKEVSPAALADALGQAIAQANAQLAVKIRQDPQLDGMGTTLTAMLRSGDRAVLAHIGDSRAYLLRAGKLRPLTEDHTLGNLVTGISASRAPVITRFLDGQPSRSLDLTAHELSAGDRYLLCSDGLSGVVEIEAIREVLVSSTSATAAVDELIAQAMEAGGPDNITVIVVDVAGESAGEQAGERSAPVVLLAAEPG